MFPYRTDITGSSMAIMRETTTMRTFFITFLFVSIITAIFFRAAPTVALIVIPPNKKHRLLFSNRCLVQLFDYHNVSVQRYKLFADTFGLNNFAPMISDSEARYGLSFAAHLLISLPPDVANKAIFRPLKSCSFRNV